jgi:uncharacterized protein with NAD-binding domain and iron-sulfur cluster
VQVDLYESRSFIGGKVGSFVDKKGNHIEMGLHVFFGCYSNLFRLMKKVQALHFQPVGKIMKQLTVLSLGLARCVTYSSLKTLNLLMS